MKPYFALIIAFFFMSTNAVFGQLKITGNVADSSYVPLMQATLKLFKANGNLIQTVSSDDKGVFRFTGLTAGSYKIEGTYLGVKGFSNLFELHQDSTINLMINHQSSTNLKGITISANKPLIERKIDRMVFNVGNSIAAKGTDLSQALALTPMLRVDDQSVSIIGKSGVSVMINDRIVNIGGADLIHYLKSLRSDDVEKIEVITTPPAKYEAQGNSGLINIVLKKNQSLGLSGSISSTYAQTTYPAFANNLNLNYQSQKISGSIKLRQYRTLTHPTEEINVIGANSMLSNDSRKDISHGFGANVSLDYKNSTKSNIGFIYDIGRSNYDIDINSIYIYKTGAVTDDILNTFSQQLNNTFTQTLNVYHDQKLDKAGKKLSSGFNFFSTLPASAVNFQTASSQTSTTDFVRNNSDLNYKIWSAQSDLTMPYKWGNIEAGLKFTNFDNNSTIGYFNLIQGNYEMDPSKSNVFEYGEKNIAGYVSSQVEFNKQWSAKAGLRYEYSIINTYSPTNNERNKFNYGRLFPSVYLSYKPDEDNTISVNYSKRINRPNFRALNPFRWYSNPNTYSTGNPLLQPSYNHNAEISYLYKGILSFTVYGQKLINGYGRLVEINGPIKIVNYQNYLTQYNSGVEATLGLKFFPWWENREFVSFNFAHGKSALPEVLLQNGSALYYSTNNTFTLSKMVNVFLNFWHSLPSTQGNTYSKGRSSLSSGVRVSLFDSKFQVNASGDDLLKGTVNRGEIYYQDFTQTFNNYYDSRRFNLNLTYTFGRSKVKGNKKQVNFKETQRAN
ncbi:outer membrane beta-barrel family protein [Pedobacter nototheniae]|uniref:outer membrane beta-barrel family protein n=1 Tax=Pedobacter nototheniae TaxID=2488994 RepID=UPI00292DF7F7|nr:outer membrane beta-barrel family protein [Pedobacter nototheniae]